MGDDHDVVDGLGDLGQQVARDEHACRRRRRTRAGTAAASGRLRGRGRWPARPGSARRGSPSSAPARPSRWRMPSEKPLTRRSPASARPTSSSTSSTRLSGSPAAAASTRRWSRARRPGWKLVGLEHRADVADRRRRARRRAGRRWWRCRRSASTRPSSIRRVVVLPAPFGPRKPVTAPSRALKLRSSTAVTSPKRLDSPWISIAAMRILPLSVVPRLCAGGAPLSSAAGRFAALPRVGSRAARSPSFGRGRSACGRGNAPAFSGTVEP